MQEFILAPAPNWRPEALLRELEFAVVDVETTGGGADRGHRITEVAAVAVRGDGEPSGEYSTLVNPERGVPRFVTALTNITQEMVDGAPRFTQVAPELERFLAGRIFVAHNAAFDYHFICAELARAARPAPLLPVLCTVRMARRLVPEVASRSLDSLAFYFGIENEARHRALGDARVTAVIFRRLLERLEEREILCWSALAALLDRRAARRKRQAMPRSIDAI